MTKRVSRRRSNFVLPFAGSPSRIVQAQQGVGA